MSYVIVFKSRLRPDVDEAYGARVEEIYRIAITMPGFVSANDYVAADGERVSIIEFDTAEHLHAWRDHVEHLKAQQQGRDQFYASYSIQICKVERSATFDASTGSWVRSP